MINRMYYKTRAKMNLKGKWLIAALVALVFLITNGQEVFNFNFGSKTGINSQDLGNSVKNQVQGMVPYGGFLGYFQDHIFPFVGIVVPFILIGVLAGIAFQVFVMAPLSLGPYQYFRKNDLGEENRDINTLLWAFRNPNYLSIVKTMFMMKLKILLWTLLFIIPGVVKSYEYSMIPFLLSRNSNMTATEAFSASKLMTSGKKGDLFVLDLSFIGWQLLGSIPFGLGIPFVQAYDLQTRAGIFNDWVGDTEPDFGAEF